MQHIHPNPIRDSILTSLYAGDRAEIFEEFLREGADIYILAGALRDAIASHYEGQSDGIPRDFDIAISNVKREFFDSILSAYGSRNRHNGYVLTEKHLPNWDLWRLEETIGLRKTNSKCSIENVLRSFNISSNAIALDLKSGLLIDAGAINSVRRRHVSFVQNPIVHSTDTFAAKSLLLELRLGYTLDQEVRSFAAKHLLHSTLLYETRKVFPSFTLVENCRESNILSGN